MLKTLFIIIISVTASALTTAGLLYRYTVPVQMKSSAESTETVLKDFEDPLPVNSPKKSVKAVVTSAIEKSANLLSEYVDLKTTPKPQTTINYVPEAPPSKAVDNPAVNPDSQVAQVTGQRSFNHELLMNDISALSQKLERFNNFLSSEVERLRSSDSKSQ